MKDICIRMAWRMAENTNKTNKYGEQSIMNDTTDASKDEPIDEITNIYKTDEWTAVIISDSRGIVKDVQLIIKPLSEFEKRIKERRRRNSPNVFQRDPDLDIY